ncbi:MAG: hypothetical protein U1C46_11925 [Bacteroidales bacterium]|nr:hypothetical protein [Bacteroidales bacterium]
MYKIISIVAFTLLFTLTSHVQAIPAFARKYQLSCQTCHSPAPRLKPFGNEFAGNGFKMLDQVAPRYYIPTGDPALSLIRDLPLAVRLEGFLKADDDTRQKLDFSAPYLVKLMSGGELANNISYYFYFFFDERGKVAGLEDAFVMFNDVFGTPLEVIVGQFQVSDPLFKRELRLTLSDYQIYRTTPGVSTANLTYDKGVMLAYGFDTGTDLVFEIVNGNGLNEAQGNARFFDRDKYKNFAGRISQEIGKHFRLGVFGYMGWEDMFSYNAAPISANKIRFWGPDMTVSFGEKLALNLQYLFRNDSEVFESLYANQSWKNVNTQGGFAELVFMPKGDDSKWYAVGLLNYVKSDLELLNHKSASLHLGYILRRNIRLAAEYTRYENPYNFAKNRFSVGFSTAF